MKSLEQNREVLQQECNDMEKQIALMEQQQVFIQQQQCIQSMVDIRTCNHARYQLVMHRLLPLLFPVKEESMDQRRHPPSSFFRVTYFQDSMSSGSFIKLQRALVQDEWINYQHHQYDINPIGNDECAMDAFQIELTVSQELTPKYQKWMKETTDADDGLRINRLHLQLLGFLEFKTSSVSSRPMSFWDDIREFIIVSVLDAATLVPLTAGPCFIQEKLVDPNQNPTHVR